MSHYLTIILPTVTGREGSLGRCLTSIAQHCHMDYEVRVVRDRPTCGAAWQAGIDQGKRDGLLWLCADDIRVLPGFFEPMVEAVERGYCPTAVVLNPDQSIQSCGINEEDRLHAPATPTDWEPVRWCTTPFCSWGQWEQIGPMVPWHFSTDRYFSYRAARAGYQTVVRSAARLIHYFDPVRRGAGMSEHDRLVHDGKLYDEMVRADQSAPG